MGYDHCFYYLKTTGKIKHKNFESLIRYCKQTNTKKEIKPTFTERLNGEKILLWGKMCSTWPVLTFLFSSICWSSFVGQFQCNLVTISFIFSYIFSSLHMFITLPFLTGHLVEIKEDFIARNSCSKKYISIVLLFIKINK